MADDEDWLATQIAASQSPFRTFQRPDSPFEAPDPGPDQVYSTQDVNRIQAYQGRSNPLKTAFGWLKGWIPHFDEGNRDNPSERITHAPQRAANLASAMVELPLHAGERYAEGFGHAMHGETAGSGFAGTGVDEPSMLVPPQSLAAFVPGLNKAIARGEASHFSTYDKVRARLEDVPLAPWNWERGTGVTGERPWLPLPGSPAEAAVWPGAEFLPEGRPAWKHQQNPFSEEAGKIRGRLQSMGHEIWPKAPDYVDSTPLGPGGNLKHLMNDPFWTDQKLGAEAGNNRNIGEVKLRAESDAKLAPFARRTEPLPLTQGVADWIREATGKEPSLRVARGASETDYIGLPHGPQERARSLPRTKVRVPDDGHTGIPEPGLIDTATGGGAYATNGLNRFNAAGEPFSKPDALIDALKWATSSAPGGGNWLVAPGKEPRWARYAKEGEPKAGKEQPSPDQLKLLAKTGDKHLNFGASLGGHTNIGTNMPDADFWITRRGAANKLGEVSREFNPESFGVLNRNHQISPDYLYYALQHMKNQGYYEGRGHGTTNLQNIKLKDVEGIPIQPSDFQLWSKGGDLRAMLAAAHPDKVAAIGKTLDALKGISPHGIASVLEQQHGIPRAQTLEALRGQGMAGQKPPVYGAYLENQLGEASEVLKQPARRPATYGLTAPDNVARIKQLIQDMPGEKSGAIWRKLQQDHPDVAGQTSYTALRNFLSRKGADVGYAAGGRPGPAPAVADPAFADRFRSAWQRAVKDNPGGPQNAMAAELGVSPVQISRWKKRISDLGPEADAAREVRSQRAKSASELAGRQGKPFWDETGRAAAENNDIEAVRRLFSGAKRPRED